MGQVSILLAFLRRLAAIAGCAALALSLTLAAAEAQRRPKQSKAPPPSPETLAQKAKILADLYERLAAADDPESAEMIAGSIEQLWLYSGSDTINLLMERSLKAAHDHKAELALKILDAVVDLAPAYTEAWNRRAYVHFVQKDYTRALADLQRVLALDSRHFKAINGVGTIMRELGHKKPALAAFRKLLEVHPFWSDAKQAVLELEREVEGQGI